MGCLRRHCIIIGVSLFLSKVVLCLTHSDINEITTIFPLNASRRMRSFLSIRELGNEKLSNQTLELPGLCMPDTCGATCGTLAGPPFKSKAKAGNDSMNSYMSISNNVSSGSLSTSPLQKRRYIMQNPQNREAYIATLSRLITTRNGWLHIARSLHGTSMKSWVYLTDRPRYRDAFGVKNLLGCTSVIIASNGGILLSNMWEMPTFLTMDYQQPARDVFRADTYDILRYGNPADPTGESIGFRYWIRGGFLISRMRPVVFIITPFTTNRERQQLGVQTELRYEAEVQSLAAALRRSIPSQQPPRIIGYTRHDRTGFEASEGDETWWGKAIVEVDQHHAEARNSRGHYVPSIDGSWRLWVEDRLEYEQHYTYPLLNWNWNRKRTSPAGP